MILNHYGELSVEWLRSLTEEKWKSLLEGTMYFHDRCLFEEIAKQYAVYNPGCPIPVNYDRDPDLSGDGGQSLDE